MASFAEPQDVADGWRPLSDTEADVATTLLARASALLRLEVSDIDARAAASPDFEVVVRGICADMAKRVLQNPEAWRVESIDDFNGTRDVSVSSGALYVAATELNQLRPVSIGPAYTVDFWG